MSRFRNIFRQFCFVLVMAFMPVAVQAGEVTIFAAASLKTALDEIVPLWQAKSGARGIVSYAGSSALARQILAGAPADIYISANVGWMDKVEDAGLVLVGTRRDLLGNRLVMVGAVPAPVALEAGAINARLGKGPLAMALVKAVPAGIYGKEALASLGLWEAVKGNVAQAANVRAALALVALGEAPLGVVYASDAVAEPRVHIVASFPQDSHAPIIYPAAALSAVSGVREFLDFLSGPEARAVFEKNGFEVKTP